MPLTHVSCWQKTGWKRISINDAVRMHPDGISARAEYFMCDLCGHFITLTSSRNDDGYFRHSSADEDKSCEDRSKIYGRGYQFIAEADPPLKLSVTGTHSMEFELGMIKLPEEMASVPGARVAIIGSSITCKQVYSFDRLLDTITYFPVGDEPQLSYTVSVFPDIKRIERYWPMEVAGVSPAGTFFDADTGKKLPRDTDIQVNRYYYLLIAKSVATGEYGVFLDRVCSVSKGSYTWNIYKVKSSVMSEGAAKFFARYGGRLTDSAVDMYPVWPVCIRLPYIYLHNAKDLYLYFNGTAVPKLAPLGIVKTMPSQEPNLIWIKDAGFEQMVALGRTKVLSYAYFWRRPFEKDNFCPRASVKDLNGIEVMPGKIQPPKEGYLSLDLPVDGFIVLSRKGKLYGRYELKCGSRFPLDGLRFGDSIKIYCGCDLVWEAELQFEKIKKRSGNIVSKLEKCTGPFVPADNRLGSLIARFPEERELKEWLYKTVTRGMIREDALKLLGSYAAKGVR